MKKKSGSVVIILAILAISILLVFTLFKGSQSYVPHMANRSSLKSSPFEGFRSNMIPYHYATYPDNKAIDEKDRFLINDISAQPTAQRVWGFDGLFGPVDLPDNNLDIYSNAQGSLDQKCQTSASGLTNSKGFLCLDNNQLSLLRTRGGNQKSCASTIGCSPV